MCLEYIEEGGGGGDGDGDGDGESDKGAPPGISLSYLPTPLSNAEEYYVDEMNDRELRRGKHTKADARQDLQRQIGFPDISLDRITWV